MQLTIRLACFFGCFVIVMTRLHLHAQTVKSKANRCPAPVSLTDETLNPVGIRSYVKEHAAKLKNPGDFICCLPEKYRKNWVAAHSSIAAQSSHMDSPRILLFNPLFRSEPEFEELPLHSIFSINGGGEGVNNPDNVELMTENEIRQELELYDIDFHDGKVAMSGRNPELCVQCHGNTNGDLTGGIKSIFEPGNDRWTRFMNGMGTCTPEEKEMIELIRKRTVKAIKSNPRFRCLSPRTSADMDPFARSEPTTNSALIFLDGALSDKNDRRVAKIIRATPEYERYKYAIVGAMICMDDKDDFSGWLPPAVLAQHDQMSLLDHRIRKAERLEDAARVILNEQAEENEKIRQHQRKAIKELKKGGRPEFRISTNALACSVKTIPDFISGMKEDWSDHSSLDRYKADTALRAFRSQFSGGDPLMRFLFEGRGIDTGHFAMAQVHGEYQRSGDGAVIHLIQMEPKGTDLKVLESDLIKPSERKKGQPALRVFKTSSKSAKAHVCEKLKALSLKAFAQESAEPSKVPVKSEPRID